jgi:hypothetical protein
MAVAARAVRNPDGPPSTLLMLSPFVLPAAGLLGTGTGAYLAARKPEC